MATQTGFLSFIRNQMGITIAQLPDASSDIATAYNMAIETVNTSFAYLAPLSYDQMIYNWAADYLLNNAIDQPGQTFFTTTRQTLKLNNFVAGVIPSASDEGTSVGIKTANQFDDFTINDLQHLKTTYGREYLRIAQKYGNLWGIS